MGQAGPGIPGKGGLEVGGSLSFLLKLAKWDEWAFLIP